MSAARQTSTAWARSSSSGSPKSPVLPSGGPAGQEELGRSQPAPVCVADPPLTKCMGKHKLRYGSEGEEVLRNHMRKEDLYGGRWANCEGT